LSLKFISLLFILSLTINLVRAEQPAYINLATYIEPPYVSLIDGEFIGINIDVIKLLAKKLNKKINYINCPFARCMSLAKDGDVDLVISIKKSAERMKFLTYLDKPYNTQYFPLNFFVKKNSQININHYDDLKDLRIGTIRAALYYDKFDQDHSLNKIEVPTYRQLVQLLLKGRIDTFLEREESVVPWIDKNTYEQQINIANYQHSKSVESFIAISKKSSLIKELSEINKAQDQLINNGDIKALFDKPHQ